MSRPAFFSRLGSWGIVGLILAALGAWMVSGLGGHSAPESQTLKPTASRPVVSVRESRAESVRREVTFNGETRPDQVVTVAAQVEGPVESAGPRKGARVAQGDELLRIHARELEQHRIRGEATLRSRELEHAAALRLRDSGYVTEGDLAARLAALETARADLADIRLRLKNLKVVAPLTGVLEERSVEAGDYVKIGQTVARIIRINPIVVAGGVTESDIRHVQPGDATTVEVQGQRLSGRVRFVAAMADERTRSFTVEIAVENPGNRIPAGLSARAVIPVQALSAHRLPASLLSLADDGAVGVKHVVADRVVFSRAELLRAEGEAVWVGGLPDKILLITRGQGFAAAGTEVDARIESDAVAAEPTAKTGG